MILKSIDIKNFRGFENKHYDLDPRMNVIVGNNTAGKTTILHAAQIALGAYLQSLTILPSSKPYRRNFVKTDRPLIYNASKNDFFPPEEDTEICVDSEIKIEGVRDGDSFCENRNIYWLRELKGNTTTHNKANVGELMNVVNMWMEYRKNESADTNIVLPLVLAFGADRIDNNYKLVERTKQRESKITKAYKFALQESVDFKSALNWIYKYDTNAKTIKEDEGTDKAFFAALETAARLKDIEVHNKELWATVKVTGGPETRLTYEMMSSGFKAMVNIVSEMAYRCILLNGWLGEKAVKETSGVVMIDEVDLYLHPHWQRHVLADLQEAFPKIQFIVTTHSPFVVQSIQSENLITLDGEISPRDPSNRGIEEIAEEEMGLSDSLRSEKYVNKVKLAEKYFKLVDEGKAHPEEIERVKKELQQLELDKDLVSDPGLKAILQYKAAVL